MITEYRMERRGGDIVFRSNLYIDLLTIEILFGHGEKIVLSPIIEETRKIVELLQDYLKDQDRKDFMEKEGLGEEDFGEIPKPPDGL
jgi:hypothetical protein